MKFRIEVRSVTSYPESATHWNISFFTQHSKPTWNLYAEMEPLCSGSVVVTAYDSESGHPGSNPERGLIYCGFDHCIGLTRAFIPRDSTLGTRAAEHKLGHANWLMVAVLRCVRPQFQWYQLAYATEMKSIQLHESIEGLSQKIVSITLHYIT